MAATTWTPSTAHDTFRKWLLTNGQVVTETPVEISGGGRRCRSMKHPEISDTASRANEVMLLAARKDALEIGADILTLYRTQDEAENLLVHRSDARPGRIATTTHGRREGAPPEVPDLTTLLTESNYTTSSRAWWLYRHPTLETYLAVHLDMVLQKSMYGGTPTALTLRTAYLPPLVAPYNVGQYDQTPFRALAQDEATPGETLALKDFSGQGGDRFSLPMSDLHTNTAVGRHHQSPGEAVRAFLGAIMAADLTKLTVPDFAFVAMRDHYPRDFAQGWPNDFETIEYKLVKTNVDLTLIEGQIAGYENDAVVNEALEHYSLFRGALGSLGFSLSPLTKMDLVRMLGGAEITPIISPANTGAISPSSYLHSVRFSPTTGEVFVICDQEAISRNSGPIAEAWETAKAVSSITGEDNVLMAFAKEQARILEVNRLEERQRQAAG